MARIVKCRQGPTKSLTKYEQRFTATTAIFAAYEGSFAFPSCFGK